LAYRKGFGFPEHFVLPLLNHQHKTYLCTQIYNSTSTRITVLHTRQTKRLPQKTEISRLFGLGTLLRQ